jgi:hypothetical protein
MLICWSFPADAAEMRIGAGTPEGSVHAGFGFRVRSALLALLALTLVGAAALLLAGALAAAVVTHKPVAATALLLPGLGLVLAAWRLSHTPRVRTVIERVAEAQTQNPFFPWFGRTPKPHLVAVYDTRPSPGDRGGSDPYFVAICDCGWVGPSRQSSEEAFHDAYTHDSHVEDQIRRPIG